MRGASVHSSAVERPRQVTRYLPSWNIFAGDSFTRHLKAGTQELRRTAFSQPGCHLNLVCPRRQIALEFPALADRAPTHHCAPPAIPAKAGLKPRCPPISISVAPPLGCRTAVFRFGPLPLSSRFLTPGWRMPRRSGLSIRRRRGLSPRQPERQGGFRTSLVTGCLSPLVLITSTVSQLVRVRVFTLV